MAAATEQPGNPPVPPPEDRRLRYVDSLRAIAALLVLWVHVSEKFKDFASPDSGWVHALTLPIAGIICFGFGFP